MQRSDFTRGFGRVAACLVALVWSGCCKTYAKAEVEPCPPMSVEMILHLQGEELDVADVYVADEIIPYCAGIDALNE